MLFVIVSASCRTLTQSDIGSVAVNVTRKIARGGSSPTVPASIVDHGTIFRSITKTHPRRFLIESGPYHPEGVNTSFRSASRAAARATRKRQHKKTGLALVNLFLTAHGLGICGVDVAASCVANSIPAIDATNTFESANNSIPKAPVAQEREHLTFSQEAGGSSPSGSSIVNCT